MSPDSADLVMQKNVSPIQSQSKLHLARTGCGRRYPPRSAKRPVSRTGARENYTSRQIEIGMVQDIENISLKLQFPSFTQNADAEALVY